MSEQPHERGEVQKIDRAVLRFKSDLNSVGHSYVDALFAAQNFVQLDFGVDEQSSNAYLIQLERERVLPDSQVYNHSPELGLEMHRLAMYSTWMPLYRETHSSREFNDWLPGAIDIVLPPDGTHTSGRCYPPLENPEEVLVTDVSCPVSTICPLKFITNDVMLGTPFLPLDQDERAVTDLIKARTDANILLRRMCEKKIIDQGQLRRAVDDCRKAYERLGV